MACQFCVKFYKHTLNQVDRECYIIMTTPTLPCNFSLIACFLTLMFHSVVMATYARSDMIFNNHFTTNLPVNLPVKKFVNLLRFDRIMAVSSWPHFLARLVALLYNDFLLDLHCAEKKQ